MTAIDLTVLTPAPWWIERRYSNGCETVPRIKCNPDGNRECGWIADLIGAPYLGYESTLANAAFIALARNDLDVKQRRGWHTEKCTEAEQWVVPQLIEHLCGKTKEEGDALIEAMYQREHDIGLLAKADAWYAAHVEKPQGEPA